MQHDSYDIKDWLKKANEDLESAKILMKESELYNSIGIHCQQAVEKILKAYLYAQKTTVKKTHDLLYLIKDCAQFDKNFSNFEDDCKILNTYYIPLRYPIAEISLSKEQAKQAFTIAEEIVNYVIATLGEGFTK